MGSVEAVGERNINALADFYVMYSPDYNPGSNRGGRGGGANEFGCRMWVARCYPIPPIFITKIVKLLPECPYLHERLKWT